MQALRTLLNRLKKAARTMRQSGTRRKPFALRRQRQRQTLKSIKTALKSFAKRSLKRPSSRQQELLSRQSAAHMLLSASLNSSKRRVQRLRTRLKPPAGQSSFSKRVSANLMILQIRSRRRLRTSRTISFRPRFKSEMRFCLPISERQQP